MDSLLTNLADYSRQLLQVGTPPVNIYTATGTKPSQDMIQLSLLARIANALESSQPTLTAVLAIQPRHADTFRELVYDVFASRAGDMGIVAWHLVDEHTLHVTLAYERGESVYYIGRYWEKIVGGLVMKGDQSNG